VEGGAKGLEEGSVWFGAWGFAVYFSQWRNGKEEGLRALSKGWARR